MSLAGAPIPPNVGAIGCDTLARSGPERLIQSARS